MSFVDPMRAIASGRDFVNDAANTLYSRQAAQGLASGNYAQALGALGQAGDMRGVAAVQDRQAAQRQAQTATQEADIAKQVAFSRQASTVLRKALTEGQDPVAAYDSLAPAFQRVGATPEQIQQYRQALAADPANFLTNIERVTADAERKLQIVNFGSGRGASVVDTGTGEEVNRLAPDRLPVISGGVSYDPVTGQPIFDARRPEYIEVEGADGQPQIVAVGPDGVSVAFEGEAPRNQAGVLSAAEIAAAGLAPGTVAQRTANGQISVIQAGPEAASRNRPTEAQNKDSFNANRMADSGAIISRLEGEGFDYGASQLTGGQFREGGRSYDAAAREWADSLLRLTTGAAATKDEVNSALISYFPRPGDSAAVRQQKAARRRQVEADALARGQGGAADRPRPAEAQSPSRRQRPAAGQAPIPNATARQNSAWQSLRLGQGAIGSRTNPRPVNPQTPLQTFNNARSGDYFLTVDGTVVGPKP